MQKKIIIQLKAELSNEQVVGLNKKLLMTAKPGDFPQPLFLTSDDLKAEADKINAGNKFEGKERFTADDLIRNFPEVYALRKLVITAKKLGVRTDSQAAALRDVVAFFQGQGNRMSYVDEKFSEAIHTDFFDRMLRDGRRGFREIVDREIKEEASHGN